jgi:hypothetical protein
MFAIDLPSAHGYHIADERIRLECYYDELDSILKEMVS